MSPGAIPLRDIHLPAEPGLWPPAPGLWLLGLLLLAAIAGALVFGMRRLNRRRRQRQALAEYGRIAQMHPPEAEPVAHLAEASQLLRRLCRRYAPRALLLKDDDWLAFLDGRDPSRPFTNGPGRILVDGPFKPHVAGADVRALTPLLRDRVARIAGGGDA